MDEGGGPAAAGRGGGAGAGQLEGMCERRGFCVDAGMWLWPTPVTNEPPSSFPLFLTPTVPQTISTDYLGGVRSDVQCLHRWQKVLQPGLVKVRTLKSAPKHTVQRVSTD